MSQIIPIQYEFDFETIDQGSASRKQEEFEKLVEHRMDKLEQSHHKVRRGTYARLGELEKRLLKIEHEHDDWKRSICKK